MSVADNFRVPEDASFYRLLALNWLRYEHGCSIVTFERSPVARTSRPDALGMTAGRLLIEVEIKISKADFDRDHSKDHRRELINDITRVVPESANYLYYMVPEHMAGYVAAAPECKQAGVITLNHSLRHAKTRIPTVYVHRRATSIHQAKLSEKSVLKMQTQQASSMCALANELLLVKLASNTKALWNIQAIVDEEVPKPFSITPPQSIADDGSKTGKIVHPHTLGEQWKNPKYREPSKDYPASPVDYRRT